VVESHTSPPQLLTQLASLLEQLKRIDLNAERKMQSAEWERLWRNRFQGVFEEVKILKTES